MCEGLRFPLRKSSQKVYTLLFTETFQSYILLQKRHAVFSQEENLVHTRGDRAWHKLLQ